MAPADPSAPPPTVVRAEHVAEHVARTVAEDVAAVMKADERYVPLVSALAARFLAFIAGV